MDFSTSDVLATGFLETLDYRHERITQAVTFSLFSRPLILQIKVVSQVVNRELFNKAK
jgi:hypothetical protein